jgi:serine/threonine protein kinase
VPGERKQTPPIVTAADPAPDRDRVATDLGHLETESLPPGPPPSDDPSLPDDPRFVIARELGRGGMGRVYLARDTALDREVAIKVVDLARLGDPARQARFFREARTMAAVRHPSLVEVYDVNPERGLLVMEYVEGESLQARLGRGRVLSPPALRRFVAELLSVLAELHQRGVVHRDIKPSNLLIDVAGRLRLLDFGIAHVVESDMTITGEVLGTPHYMAPEQLRGEPVGFPADVYGAAITAFEAATATRPSLELGEEAAAARMLAATGDPPLSRAVARGLRLVPSERYASAIEFRAAIDAPVRKRWPRRAALCAAAAAAVVIGGLTIAGDSDPAPARAAPPVFASQDPVLVRTYGRLTEAIDAGELGIAYSLADELLERAGDQPAVLYQAMRLNLWRELPREAIERLAARAAAVPLASPQRALVAGVVAIAGHDFAGAERHFRAGLAELPGDRDLRYGLFEALWHQGEVDDAVAIYRAITDEHPMFRFGDRHVLEHYADRRDAAGLAWLASGQGSVSRVALEGRSALAMEGPGAAARARGYLDVLGLADRALLLAMAGPDERAEAARRDLERADPRGLWPTVLRLALACAGGEPDEIARLVPIVVAARGSEEWEYRLAMQALAALAASPEVPASLAEHAARTLDRIGPEPGRAASTDAGRALLAERMGDEGSLAALTGSRFAEVAALAEGLLAARRGDHAGAGRALDRALTTPSDGRFRLAEHYHRARLARTVGDAAKVRSSCQAVLAPRWLDPAWGSLGPACRTWLAEIP